MHDLEGPWTVSNVAIDGNGNGSNADDKNIVERGSEYWNNKNVLTFSLPASIMVRFFTSSCLLEISLLQTSYSNGNDGVSSLNRIVFTRNLGDGVDGDVQYSMETKKL